METKITTIYLIRHSEKMRLPHSAAENYDRTQPLTVFGEQKARALVEVEELRNADLAYCSPYARTISTLRYLQEADGFRMVLDTRLRELDFGAKPPDGEKPVRLSAMPGGDPRAKLWEDRDFAFEGGESLNQCIARMEEVIQEIVAAHPGKKVLVGSHGHSICGYLSSLVTGIDLAYERKLPKPSIVRVVFEGGHAVEAERVSFALEFVREPEAL